MSAVSPTCWWCWYERLKVVVQRCVCYGPTNVEVLSGGGIWEEA